MDFHILSEDGKIRNTAKLTFWLFENPLRHTQIWAKQVRGSLSSPYLAVGRQVPTETNWHAIVTFAVVQKYGDCAYILDIKI